ncbi:MAG: carbohydrate ABC transporter permease [Acetobacteraceae bacterium]|nr:carbohydrate ABC transporter permease [Acetobacteraceae bacterium]
MSTTTADNGLVAATYVARPAIQMRRIAQRRRYLTNAMVAMFSVVVLIWTLTPIYNMVMLAFQSNGDVFSEHIWPPRPSAASFWIVITQGYWYLEHFWHQFGNSVYIAVMTTGIVLVIGTMTSFSVGRMRIRNGWLVTNAALLTYVIPASFLAIPFYLITIVRSIAE